MSPMVNKRRKSPLEEAQRRRWTSSSKRRPTRTPGAGSWTGSEDQPLSPLHQPVVTTMGKQVAVFPTPFCPFLESAASSDSVYSIAWKRVGAYPVPIGLYLAHS